MWSCPQGDLNWAIHHSINIWPWSMHYTVALGKHTSYTNSNSNTLSFVVTRVVHTWTTPSMFQGMLLLRGCVPGMDWIGEYPIWLCTSGQFNNQPDATCKVKLASSLVRSSILHAEKRRGLVIEVTIPILSYEGQSEDENELGDQIVNEIQGTAIHNWHKIRLYTIEGGRAVQLF